MIKKRWVIEIMVVEWTAVDSLLIILQNEVCFSHVHKKIIYILYRLQFLRLWINTNLTFGINGYLILIWLHINSPNLQIKFYRETHKNKLFSRKNVDLELQSWIIMLCWSYRKLYAPQYCYCFNMWCHWLCNCKLMLYSRAHTHTGT